MHFDLQKMLKGKIVIKNPLEDTYEPLVRELGEALDCFARVEGGEQAEIATMIGRVNEISRDIQNSKQGWGRFLTLEADRVKMSTDLRDLVDQVQQRESGLTTAAERVEEEIGRFRNAWLPRLDS